MGDRGNICIEYSRVKDSEARRIWFYTHWRGDEMPKLVRNAMAKKWRWMDEGYLARIIFETLTLGDRDVETGFAITPEPYDTPHPYVVVDTGRKTVSFVREQDWTGKPPKSQRPFEWTFEEFAALQDHDLAGSWRVASGITD